MRLILAAVFVCAACGGSSEPPKSPRAPATEGSDADSPARAAAAPDRGCPDARQREREAVRAYLRAMDMFDGEQLDEVVNEWMSEQSSDGFAADLRAEHEALAADGLTDPEDDALADAVTESAKACATAASQSPH